MIDLRDIRSLLFVPGHHGERFAKAAAAGPDCVCIDLEDAVAPAEREAAREQVAAFLSAQPAGHRFGVRINTLDSDDGSRDLHWLRAQAGRCAFVMLAKTERPEQLQRLAAAAAVPQIALIESASAVMAAAVIAAEQPQLQALMLGGADLAADLGCAFAWEPLLHARSVLVLAAASVRLAAIDVPWLDVADSEGLGAETRRVAALGYTAKALIHPSQVEPVHAAFTPSAAQLERARRVVNAAEANPGAMLLDGRMVDRPVVLAAQRLLRRAAA